MRVLAVVEAAAISAIAGYGYGVGNKEMAEGCALIVLMVLAAYVFFEVGECR